MWILVRLAIRDVNVLNIQMKFMDAPITLETFFKATYASSLNANSLTGSNSYLFSGRNNGAFSAIVH